MKRNPSGIGHSCPQQCATFESILAIFQTPGRIFQVAADWKVRAPIRGGAEPQAMAFAFENSHCSSGSLGLNYQATREIRPIGARDNSRRNRPGDGYKSAHG
jgi:hypothetical protein